MKQSKQGSRPAAPRGIRQMDVQARPHGNTSTVQDTTSSSEPNHTEAPSEPGPFDQPITSFLEEYDFAGKTIIPFCSHGGGRFGQSLTAISKLASDATQPWASPCPSTTPAAAACRTI